jgi:hypothetical protein
LGESVFGHHATLEQAAFGSNCDRHCERSEAIQGYGGRLATLDRGVARALLAMMVWTAPPKRHRVPNVVA